MKYSELRDTIASETGIHKGDVDKVIRELADVTVDAIKCDDEVTIPGLGKLKVSNRAERQGRNPATGEPMTIKASKSIKLTIAKAVKDKLNG